MDRKLQPGVLRRVSFFWTLCLHDLSPTAVEARRPIKYPQIRASFSILR